MNTTTNEPNPNKYRESYEPRIISGNSNFYRFKHSLELHNIRQLPEGGSVTLASMVPIIWLALRRGPKVGLFAGAVYGLVQLAVMPQIYFLPQVLLDYPLAFGCLGLAGFFQKTLGTSRRNSSHYWALYYALDFRSAFLCFIRTCRDEPMGLLGTLQRKLLGARTHNKPICDFLAAEKQSPKNVYVKKDGYRNMGKLASEDLQKILNCIKKDFRVIVPPMIGYDAGVHLLHGKYVAVATDPCTGVPEEWFGWLLINYACFRCGAVWG